MLRSALCKFRRLLNQLEINLLGDDGDTWETELKKFLRKEPCWVKVAVANKLLKLVTTVKVGAVKQFIAADYFRTGQVVDGVKYSTLFGDNFNKHLLPKIEENVQKARLQVHKLLKGSKDLSIRMEIGEDKEETTLTHLHQLLKVQGNGQKGTLLTNGYANIFYICDISGILWAVYADWYVDGWRLSAFSVENPYPWGAGAQVCSR